MKSGRPLTDLPGWNDDIPNIVRRRVRFSVPIGVLAVGLVCVFPVSLAARVPVEMSAEAVSGFLDKEIGARLGALHIPGASVVVVRDGRILVMKGYGTADLEKKTPVDPARTIFRLASVTKTFTATALLREYQEGRIDLRRDLRPLFNGILRGAMTPVTPLHLLTHTAGFDERVMRIAGRTQESILPLDEYLRADMPPLVRTPGRFYQYSNHGLTLAGLLIEQTSRRNYFQYVEEEILEPLGMGHTLFPERKGMPADMAGAYSYDGRKHVKQLPVYLNIGPAGSLVSTAEDMAAFLVMHLENGSTAHGEILRADTARFMHATAYRPHPDVAGSALGFYERLESGERLLEHAGDLAGFSAQLVLIPEAKTGWFLAYNLNPETKLREDFTRAFLNRWFPDVPGQLPHFEDAKERAAGVSGSYRMTRYARETWEKILGAFFILTVKDHDDGTITVRVPMDLFPPMVLQLQEISRSPAGLLYRETSGSARLFFPDPRESAGNDGRALAMGMFVVPMTFERLSWWEGPVVQGFLSLVSQLTFLVFFLATTGRLLIRKIRRAPSLPEVDRALYGMAAAHLVFLGAFGGLLAYYQTSLLFDVRLALYPVLLLPSAGVFMTAVALVFLVRSLHGREGGRSARIVRIWTAGTGCLFLWFLHASNLLGFRI